MCDHIETLQLKNNWFKGIDGFEKITSNDEKFFDMKEKTPLKMFKKMTVTFHCNF